MTEGIRITESTGDTRVTSSGDTRVTEGYFEGLVNLAAAGAVVAVATAILVNSASLSSTNTSLFAGISDFQGLSELSATSSSSSLGGGYFQSFSELTATSSSSSVGTREHPAVSSISGESSIEAEYIRKTQGSSSSTAESSVLSEGTFVQYVDSSISSSSSLSSEGVKTLYGLFRPDTEDATRITESGDIRVTEDGDIRFTTGVIFNGANSSLVADSVQVIFNGVPYYKEGNVWKRFEPYVKHNGEWKEPVTIQYKIAGQWKRVY